MSNLIVLKHPTNKKTEAETAKSEMEKADTDITVVLVDQDIEIQTIPLFA